jgi:hypothetical protein
MARFNQCLAYGCLRSSQEIETRFVFMFSWDDLLKVNVDNLLKVAKNDTGWCNIVK